MTTKQKFKVTYSTLASPDPELHRLYDEAVANFRANVGKTYPLFINGEERFVDETFAKTMADRIVLMREGRIVQK